MAGDGGYPRFDEDAVAALEEVTRTELRRTRGYESEFLGMTEPAARSRAGDLNLELRMIAPGDPITFDLRPRRMTVVIADGEVRETFAG